jgi:hypothetical protein
MLFPQQILTPQKMWPAENFDPTKLLTTQQTKKLGWGVGFNLPKKFSQIWPQHFWPLKIVWPRKMLTLKNVATNKIVTPKNILPPKNCDTQKMLTPKKWWPTKNVDPKKCWPQKMLSPEFFLPLQNVDHPKWLTPQKNKGGRSHDLFPPARLQLFTVLTAKTP